MHQSLKALSQKLMSAVWDIFPILAVIVLFQIFVIQKPFPDLGHNLIGIVLVVVGLFIFILGLESALFPLGERMANQFALKGSVAWVIIFGFALGFATTIAEPALTVIAREAGKLTAEAGLIPSDSRESFILILRITIALSVGVACALGVIRIIMGWPLTYFLMTGYALIVLTTLVAPVEIVGIAYDAGGITTSTITVPLLTALGVGLASAIRGRHPIIDGFGIIALASLLPIFFVLVFGIIFFRMV